MPLLNELTYTREEGYDYVRRNDVIRCDSYSRIAEQINNGNTMEYLQPTPKQRILAALYDIKKSQTPKADDEMIIGEVKEKIVYVTVDAGVRKLQEIELIEN